MCRLLCTLVYKCEVRVCVCVCVVQWNPSLTICQGSAKIMSLKRDIVIAEFSEKRYIQRLYRYTSINIAYFSVEKTTHDC